MKENFPTVLTELRDENAIQLNYSELLKQCQNTEISVTAELSCSQPHPVAREENL
jgi:hypothetical protein